MNKYQALLNELYSGCVLEDCDNEKVNCELYVGFKELVEKATPKKPIFYSNEQGKDFWSCPNCRGHLCYVDQEDTCGIYCPQCGQRLYWIEND